MPEVYKIADRELNADPAHLDELFEVNSKQMPRFTDWPDAELAAMDVPTLYICGDR